VQLSVLTRPASLARTHTSRRCDTGQTSACTRRTLKCRAKESQLPRSTLRNSFPGFPFIFYFFGAKQQDCLIRMRIIGSRRLRRNNTTTSQIYTTTTTTTTRDEHNMPVSLVVVAFVFSLQLKRVKIQFWRTSRQRRESWSNVHLPTNENTWLSTAGDLIG
jgi:hypothetical protein